VLETLGIKQANKERERERERERGEERRDSEYTLNGTNSSFTNVNG